MDFTSAEVSQALPSESALQHAEASLLTHLPDVGLGFEHIKKHLLNDIAPAFTGSSRCPNYYAFTTGAVTDAALFADWVGSTYDQNVQVHLPKETIATRLEDTTLRMLQQLLSFGETDFKGRIFTTGATASNLVGMALGREFVVAEAGRRNFSPSHTSIAKLGVMEACLQARVKNIQVLSTLPHSSVYKAASAVGIGRNSIILLPLSDDEPWRFDMEALEQHLSADGVANIISISAGEVSSGRFATNGEEMTRIRSLANQYGAWIHVDGAFGLQALVLPHAEAYTALNEGVSGLHLADSITGDAHKLLNVPYDCGFFFTRHLELQQTVFLNPSSAYLSTTALSIPSPLNLGVENSRRFRALPVYAALFAYGRIWHCDLLERQIALARRVASYIVNSTAYELLPTDDLDKIYMVVLFRARSDTLNSQLVSLLNASKQIHISGLPWKGRPAARIAVGTWRVDVEKDFELLVRALEATSRDDGVP
ncbi:pyridoxal phosphate-dependent transferase [Mycena latifolia]|nr:pyridoxal phosphate-dependent transferase [Mycena latifolia]